MRKLMAGAVVAVAVLALSGIIASRVATTQASDDLGQEAAGPSSSAAGGYEAIEAGGFPLTEGDPQPGPDDESDEARPFIGIALSTLPDAEAEALEIEGGAFVRRVLDEGPSAGILHAGDVIVAINENEIASADGVIAAVRAARPADVLTFTVVRDGDALDVDVVVGQREHEFARHIQAASSPHTRLLHHIQQLGNSFVSAEFVVETETGFQTFRAVVGTVSSVDVEAGTFLLTPKDGSDPIAYTISDDTLVNLLQEGSLGGLNATDPTLVVDVDGDVEIINQGDKLFEFTLHPALSISPKFRVHGNTRGLLPHLRGFRDRQLPAGRFPGLGERSELRERLWDALPPEILERLEGLHIGPDDLELDLDLRIEGLFDGLDKLKCDEESEGESTRRFTLRCSNVERDSTQ